MPWYEDWFDRAEYELVYRRRDEQEAEQAADLIERVAQPAPGAQLLDVGCGRGRHARAFARRGYHVTGLDLSEQAIEAARHRAAADNLTIAFRQQDMRRPMGTDDFDGAVNLFSSFGYFESDEEHQRVVSHIARALRPGGFFVQDFMNAPQVRASLVPQNTRSENGLQIEERRWIENGRINKEITLHSEEERGPASGESPDGERPASPPRTFRESVRLLELDDFRRFYNEAGLTLQNTFGTYDGTPYQQDSPRLILFARNATS